MRERLEFKLVVLVFVSLTAGVLFSSIFVTRMEKAHVYELARERLVGTARIISAGIERTMLEGKAETTQNMIRDLGMVGGFESILVFNETGQKAFSHEGETVEAETLRKLAATGQELAVIEGQTLLVYLPLHNKPACSGCHAQDTPILGAVRVSVSLAKEYAQLSEFGFFIALWSIVGVIILGGAFWFMIRKFVIIPLTSLERAAANMANGDFTFVTDIDSNDEIGRLDHSIKRSLQSVSEILRLVKDVSKRVSLTADAVESDSGSVAESTQIEAEAVAEISSSVEELNAAITEIAEGTDGLAKSVEETASSVEEMASTIATITDVTHEVSEGVDATSSSIEQLSATTKEVADNAHKLATTTDETLSSIEEIIFSIKEVEQSAKESARLSEKVEEDATSLGVASIKRVMEGMERIRESVLKTSQTVKKLEGRSEEIGNILDVIDEITDQTTLLSLNAAILAAQAGEHGKGFSVVASEIKDLAERTALSTKEIDNLISSVRHEVSDSVKAMDSGMSAVEEGMEAAQGSSSALKKILESSRRSAEMAASIKKATEEQAGAARYVTESTERVRAMVDMIAKATAEQTRGVTLIIKASERIRDASSQADKATKQQAQGSKQIAEVVESISDRSRLISRAIYEQKIGSNQIWSSVEKIKDLPAGNRNTAFRINRSLQRLLKDAELVASEMERFKLFETSGARVIRLGVVPFGPPASMYRKFGPLIEYLGKQTGIRFELKVGSDFAAAVDDICSGTTQLCYMTSYTYHSARREGGVEIIAMTLRDGKPFHHSVIIARSGGPVASPADIRGKTMAFVDPHSFSGYMMPRAMLMDEGIRIKDLAYHQFLGFHDDVVKVVLKGEFDAGGVMEGAAAKYLDSGIRVVKTSAEIPEFNIAAGKSLAEEDRERIKSALLRLNDGSAESRSILRAVSDSCTGFVTAADADYDIVRRVIARVEEG